MRVPKYYISMGYITHKYTFAHIKIDGYQKRIMGRERNFMQIYTHVCMCVCMYVCMYLYIFIYVYMCMYVCMLDNSH